MQQHDEEEMMYLSLSDAAAAVSMHRVGPSVKRLPCCASHQPRCTTCNVIRPEANQNKMLDELSSKALAFVLLIDAGMAANQAANKPKVADEDSAEQILGNPRLMKHIEENTCRWIEGVGPDGLVQRSAAATVQDNEICNIT